MEIALYIVLIGILMTVAFVNVRFGRINVRPALTRTAIVYGVVLTLFLYYTSIKAIDSSNYQASFTYLGSVDYTTDRLYYAFAKTIKDLGGDYQFLRLCIGIISLIPVLILIKKESGRMNVPLFFLFSMVFPYFQNMVSLRNTIASTVVVIAFLIYFMHNKKMIATVLTYVLLFIASLFHDTSIVYVLLFSLMLIMKRISHMKRNYWLLFGVAILMIIIIRMGIATTLLNSIVGETNASYIARLDKIGYGFLIITAIQLIFMFIVQRSEREREFIDGADPLNNDVMLLFYSTIILIPLYSINVLFFRLFRNIMIFGYLICAKNYWVTKGGKNRALVMLLVLFVLMLYDANGVGTLKSILLES